MEPTRAVAARPRSRLAIASMGLGAVLTFGLLVALGTWQVQRLVWKRDLIARVETRVNGPPEAPPPRPQWAGITAASDEYRHVRVEGRFLHDHETLVQALTERGAGYWVMTPLRRPDGTIILVNRGFIPLERRDAAKREPGPDVVAVTGLLRMSEPGGGFLRRNDPASGRWYSRDVAAIARTQGLGETAPFFIDADASPNPGGLPVGGLTVIAFSNNHLVYALTWYALALMVAGGSWFAWREARRAGWEEGASESKPRCPL